jgi:hypothetical protein
LPRPPKRLRWQKASSPVAGRSRPSLTNSKYSYCARFRWTQCSPVETAAESQHHAS